MTEEVKKEEIKVEKPTFVEGEQKEEKPAEVASEAVEEKKEEVKVEKPTSVEGEQKEEKPAEVASEAPAVDEVVAEEEKKDIEVPEKFKKLVKEIEEMSVLDLSELVKILEEKFGVSAMAPVVAVAGGAPAGESPAEEKSVFNIELTAIGDKKIEVIKAVRDITEKGLKEAKDIVDAAMTSPQMVKENVKKDDAEEIKKKLETAGAKVELK